MNRLATASLSVKHAASQVLHLYADLRVGATAEEKRCYKMTDSILLTFDDYGSEKEVKDVLSILRTKQVRALFFLQGDWAKANPSLVSLIRANHHIIGNHTLTHQVLLGQSEANIIREINGGMADGPWFRPPQGRYNNTIRRIAQQLGYGICYWSIDSRDWTGATPKEMRHTILNELHKGAVILFHIHGKHTRAVLPGLIDDIRSRGYHLTDDSEPDWSPTL